MKTKKIWVLALVLNGFLYAQTGDWVAKVDQKVISGKDFQNTYESQLDIMEILSNYQMETSQLKSNKQYQLQFLEEHVANQLLLDRLKQENKSKKFLNEAWAKKTSQSVAQYIEDQLYIRQYLLKELLPKTEPATDDEVAKVYDQHKDKFKSMTTAQASAIIKEKVREQKAMMLLGKLRERVKGESSIKINYDRFEK
mgnify:CR=1 FL=1